MNGVEDTKVLEDSDEVLNLGSSEKPSGMLSTSSVFLVR